jgi:hypothetical protein
MDHSKVQYWGGMDNMLYTTGDTKSQLEALTHVYNDVEEGKASISSINVDRDMHDVSSFGSPYTTMINSGRTTITITVEKFG